MAEETEKKKIEEIKKKIERLKIENKAKERRIKELREEVEALHNSLSYRFGRWVAETKIGGALKNFLRKYF